MLVHSTKQHVQQVHTGLTMLQRRGIVRLSQKIDPRGRRPAHTRVILNGNVRLHYDLFDGASIDEQYLEECDLYFKRSYAPQVVSQLGDAAAKVRPLGLNYAVFPDHADWNALRRAIALLSPGREQLRELARALNVGDKFFHTPRVSQTEALPDYDAEPRVLFMVTTWDPVDDPSRPASEVDDRRVINETRADCIRRLRAEFGERFFGGFRHTPVAVRDYPDVLVPDAKLSSSGRYLATMRKFPICVATTGLHGSIGWKFAEYIAYSKAIISERLQYSVTGDLAEHVNYLPFDSPAECVEAAGRLCEDRELRNSIMSANCRYYYQHMRPDTLVLKTLIAAATANHDR
jgi:hypothetical protein